jgi:DUF971 family protein
MADGVFEPDQIERVGEVGLKIRWADGHESIYPWTWLRSACPCAACRQAGKVPFASSILALELKPVGRYAVNIHFSDGHTTGIFSYDYLRSLCPCEACRPKEVLEG